MLEKTHRHLPQRPSVTDHQSAVTERTGRRSDGPRSQPVDPGVRTELEESFGHRFDDVRIWPGESPWATPESLGADAYAVGNDVVFAAGAYEPATLEGRFLLAHELAHVVQQSHSPDGDAMPTVGDPASAAESDASAAALQAVSGGQATVQVAAPPTVARGMFDMIKHIVEPLTGGASESVHQHDAAQANHHANDAYRSASHDGHISAAEGGSLHHAQRNFGLMRGQLGEMKARDREMDHADRGFESIGGGLGRLLFSDGGSAAGSRHLTSGQRSHMMQHGAEQAGVGGGLFGGIGDMIGGGISSLAGFLGGPLGFNPLDLFGSGGGQQKTANARDIGTVRMQSAEQRAEDTFRMMSNAQKHGDDVMKGIIGNLR